MKGKYAAKAANKRAELEASGNLALHQKRVAALTAENKRLKERHAAADKAHRAEVRRLKAQINEGVSPMLHVVEQENRRLKERADIAERETKRIRQLWDRASSRMMDHFISGHGSTGIEATEELVKLIGPADDVRTTIVGNHDLRMMKSKSLSSESYVTGEADTDEVERVRTLQRARGERR